MLSVPFIAKLPARIAARFGLLPGLFLVVAGVVGALAAQQQGESVRIVTRSGESMLQVELALDEATQRRGLMFRRSLAPDHGMLFIYDRERDIAMWMKNTFLSLDMLFFDRDGQIVRIAERTEPFSERIIAAGQPVYGVLEVNAGTAERLGIRPGDRLVHPLLGVSR